MIWNQTLINLFQKGGFAMWPLLACSIVGAAIIAERAIYFLMLRLDYKSFSERLKALLLSRKIKEAVLLCRKHPNPVPKIAEQYLQNLAYDDLRGDILKREGS